MLGTAFLIVFNSLFFSKVLFCYYCSIILISVALRPGNALRKYNSERKLQMPRLQLGIFCYLTSGVLFLEMITCMCEKSPVADGILKMCNGTFHFVTFLHI